MITTVITSLSFTIILRVNDKENLLCVRSFFRYNLEKYYSTDSQKRFLSLVKLPFWVESLFRLALLASVPQELVFFLHQKLPNGWPVVTVVRFKIETNLMNRANAASDKG